MKKRFSVILVVGLCLAHPVALRAEPPSPRRESETTYFKLLIGDKKVGYMVHSVTRKPGGDITTTDRMRLDTMRFGVRVTAEETTTFVERGDGTPLRIETSSKTGPMRRRVSAKFEKGRIIVVSDVGGRKRRRVFRADAEALMPEALQRLTVKKLAAGEGFSFKTYNPALGFAEPIRVDVTLLGPADVTVMGKRMRLTKVKAVTAKPPMTTFEFLDCSGEMWRSVEKTIGVVMERTTRGDALGGKEERLDVSGYVVRTNLVMTPDFTKKLDELVLDVRHVSKPPEELFMQTPRQRVQKRPGSVRLVLKRLGDGEREKASAEALKPFLAPSPIIQSDAPAVKKLAAKAVAGVSEPAKKAKALERFVHDYIEESTYTVVYASALEVLKSRKGDCSEFAVLLAALARAEGLPSRLVFGLLGQGNAFVGHMWTEVYVDGWLPLDATRPAETLSPTHLAMVKLTSGDSEELARHGMNALAAMRGLRITVVSYTIDGKTFTMRRGKKAK